MSVMKQRGPHFCIPKYISRKGIGTFKIQYLVFKNVCHSVFIFITLCNAEK